MLESLRRSASSVFAWIILGVLALVFGLSFGLPSDSLTLGTAPLVKIHGNSIGDRDYLYQFNLMSRVIPMPKDVRMQELMGLKEEVLDAAVEREVLAQTARDMGLAATKKDAEDLTLDGHLIILGDTYDWLGDSKFNYDYFTKQWLASLQVTEPKYLEYQTDELLARTVRDLITASVVVPENAIRAEYEAQNNRLSLRYVRFDATNYAQLVDPTPEEVTRYADANKDPLSQQLANQGIRFTKLPKQARLHLLQVAKDDPEASKKLADARRRVSAGEDFRQVARELSVHESAGRGGDYGWVNEEGTGTGLDPVIDETIASLATGKISSPIEAEDGSYLLWIRGRREGDVPEADAIAQLAEDALREERGRALAKQAADEALLALKGGKNLAELFEAPAALPTVENPIESLDEATAPADDGKPKLRITGLFQKDKPIPGLGNLPELVMAAWDADKNVEAIDRVFPTPTGFVIAGIDRKDVATDEGFAEARPAITRKLEQEKAAKLLSHFASRRCLEAKGRGAIVPSQGRISRLMVYDTKLGEDEEGNRVMRPYSVCDRVGMRGGLLRTGLMAQQNGGSAQ